MGPHVAIFLCGRLRSIDSMQLSCCVAFFNRIQPFFLVSASHPFHSVRLDTQFNYPSTPLAHLYSHKHATYSFSYTAQSNEFTNIHRPAIAHHDQIRQFNFFSTAARNSITRPLCSLQEIPPCRQSRMPILSPRLLHGTQVKKNRFKPPHNSTKCRNPSQNQWPWLCAQTQSRTPIQPTYSFSLRLF